MDRETCSERCRSCGSGGLQVILRFGPTPLADVLAESESPSPSEILAPLTWCFCPACGLAQITETISPQILFGDDYPYFSSVSESLRHHFQAGAEEIFSRKSLRPDSLVVEAASNDGAMLRHFASRGIRVLGIDPAAGPVAAARREGIPTLKDFFTRELAAHIREKNGRGADVFLANNVLAHVPDLNGFVKGIEILLEPDGLAVLEMHYVGDLVENDQFDTIYHQHLCYFSLSSLQPLFERHGLYINRVVRIPTYGGSLRIFVERRKAADASVPALLERERAQGLTRADYYRAFALRACGIRDTLVDMVERIRRSGARIAAYGAAAKAATLLAFCGFTRDQIEFVADLNPFKQGKFMGGNLIPIQHPRRLVEDLPDYVLLLAWNFAGEILEQQKEYRRRGGRFILPLPEPKIIESDAGGAE